MPLRDHFRSPVNDTHSWDEVHGQWPGEIVRHLSTLLPAGFRAAPNVHLSSAFDVDVAGHGLDTRDPDAPSDAGSGGAAMLTAQAPTLTVEAELSKLDEYEVRIYDTERGRQLVAAIEIVSPSNKDRPNARAIFIGKVAALLREGVSVSFVDLVTIRQSNLYAELLTSLDCTDPGLTAPPTHLYAVSLRTRKPSQRRSLLDAWFYPMTVGELLPTLPIWLAAELRVMLPLEPSYQETCRILGIA